MIDKSRFIVQTLYIGNFFPKTVMLSCEAQYIPYTIIFREVNNMLKQVSIYAENKKGTFQDLTSLLMQEGINILGSVTQNSTEYGVVRMIVSDTEKTIDLLKANGYLCKSTHIIGVEMADKVGSLNHLLLALLDGNINVDYTYLCFNRETGMPIIILHTEDIFEVENYLKTKGFVVQQ